jgi:hypothetical protein
MAQRRANAECCRFEQVFPTRPGDLLRLLWQVAVADEA